MIEVEWKDQIAPRVRLAHAVAYVDHDPRFVFEVCFGAHFFEVDARLPIAHRFSYGRFEQAQELKAAGREYHALGFAAEIGPHYALAQVGQQQDFERLLDVLIAVNVSEAARRVRQYGEAPPVPTIFELIFRLFRCQPKSTVPVATTVPIV